jgi:hypothetical protein
MKARPFHSQDIHEVTRPTMHSHCTIMHNHRSPFDTGSNISLTRHIHGEIRESWSSLYHRTLYNYHTHSHIYVLAWRDGG